MAKRKRTKGQTTSTKLKIEKQVAHWKPGVNSGAPEGYVVPAPLVYPFVNLAQTWSHEWGKESYNLLSVIR